MPYIPGLMGQVPASGRPAPTSTSRTGGTPGAGGSSWEATKARLLAQKEAANAEAGPSSDILTQAEAYGSYTAGAGTIPMPNTGYYESSADAYGTLNPNDPASRKWNWGYTSVTEAVTAYDDPELVDPYLRGWLENFAKSIHPQMNGSSIWEDAVKVAQQKSMRGEFVTPKSIALGWLNDWKRGTGKDDDSSGGGGGYGGGGFGGGGSTVNLMNEYDARAFVNAMSLEMQGRTITDGEFKKYYDKILKLQRENPATLSDDGTEMVSPIGQAGIQYGLEEQMRDTEDFVTEQIGSEALGLIESFLQEKVARHG
jgi:hypothetical protein